MSLAFWGWIHRRNGPQKLLARNDKFTDTSILSVRSFGHNMEKHCLSFFDMTTPLQKLEPTSAHYTTHRLSGAVFLTLMVFDWERNDIVRVHRVL
jgi:hypothetical protein